MYIAVYLGCAIVLINTYIMLKKYDSKYNTGTSTQLQMSKYQFNAQGHVIKNKIYNIALHKKTN